MRLNRDEIVRTFLASHKWPKLNVTQQKSVEQGILDTDENFLVIAPTGGGKTGVAELVIRRSLDHDPPKRVLYVAPLKALTEGNLDEFRAHLSGRKVMSLWEKNSLTEADVVVALNEQAYKALLKTPDMVGNFSVLILDELHIMYQPSRGHTVEKILTLAKRMGLRIICLSATVEDKEELRSWLNAVLVEVPESDRPIPLKPQDFPERDFIKAILKFDKPPVLVFRGTKRNVEATAKRLSAAIQSDKGPETYGKVKDLEEEMRNRMRIDMTERLGELATCLSNGVAWHHGNLPPGIRDYIEELYAARKIDFIVCTTTLAYGFDSPTRTVVIYDVMRWAGENKMEPIGVHEFRQMAGRAGRPSKAEFDDGFVCGIVRSAGDQKELNRYRTAKLEPVESHLGNIDDYYKKAVMEFVYAGNESADAISSILANSFYRSKASAKPSAYGLYNPVAEITRHLAELVREEYIHPLPGDQFRLSPVGTFVVEFQLGRFESFDLRVFSEINRYAKAFPAGTPIPFGPAVIYQVCKITETALPSTKRTLPDQSQKAIAGFGWRSNDPVGRTTLALVDWMDLKAVGDIETRCGVQAEAIEAVSRNLAENGFYAFIRLAKLNGYQLDPIYDVLTDSLKDGVPPELVPLSNIDGIGRKRAEGIVKACDATVQVAAVSAPYDSRPVGSEIKRKDKVFAKKGDQITGRNCLAFLRSYLRLFGDDDLMKLLQSEQGIGPVTAGKVLALLKAGAGH